MIIDYYDDQGNAWQVKGDPLTPNEEAELGNICAIKYSNPLEDSPVKTRAVYDNVAQNKYYVKMVRNRLYDPADDRYNVVSKPPKSQNQFITKSRKEPEKDIVRQGIGEGVTNCKSNKPFVQPQTQRKGDFKKVTQAAFDHYVHFLSNRSKKYYTAATREM